MATHLTPPKQSRSRRTLERIVRASLEILEEEGVDGLTVQAIVARADSSVGSFYARFAGKDDLLEYLGDRVWREAAQRWDDALASRDLSGLSLSELVDGAVRLLADAGRSRASYLKALAQAPTTGDEAYLAFQGHAIEGLGVLLMAKASEMGHPDPAVAIRLGLRAVLALLEGPFPPGSETLPLERRLEEAGRLLHGYLTAGEAAGRSTGQVDFFDIWS
ncbi:MAG TPA: TetR/AcrR family transcriptional regulator [Longimicrobiales bacterium]|nr:TetR/AcrR family transcriptional regulator [Longimicrobiales bacterium]